MSSILNLILLQATAQEEFTILSLLEKGGYVMYPILFLFSAAVFLFIERYLYIRKTTKIDENFLHNINELLLAGNIQAAIKACEFVDECAEAVIETALEAGYVSIVIADHGNADFAVNPDGSPNTAHSLNPVPVVLVTDDKVKLKNGILADVAPTLLARLGVDAPIDMTGECLIA